MYQIIKNGSPIGLTEHPTYVEPLDNGSYGLCDEARARGIAYEGQVYSLEGRPAMEDTETVVLPQTDTGMVLGAHAATMKAAAEEMTNTQLALCEVFELLTGGDQ